MEKKIERFTKIYPWYSGLTGDLLFYIAIDTLFLTAVKNFSAAQIVSMTSVSKIACILLQFPLLWVIQRIGNTASLRLGALFMLLSSVFITFGPNYYLVALGRIFHDVAFIFRNVVAVTLENNLDLIGRRDRFIGLRTAANTIYAVITMLISFVASLMFNYNNYLPMFGCITTCVIGLILSFFMVDYSKYNKISPKNKGEKIKFKYTKFIILTIIVYGIYYSIVTIGQTDGKLFIQQHLLLDFNIEKTALIIGAVVCISRIIRVFSNVVFARLYEKYKSKVGVILPILLCSSIGLMLFGSFIHNILIKIIVMGMGYIIILFIRDPFRLFIEDVVFDNTAKENHQTIMTMLALAIQVITSGMTLGFTFILLKYPLLIEIIIIFVVTLIEIVFCIRLYKMIIASKVKNDKKVISI